MNKSVAKKFRLCLVWILVLLCLTACGTTSGSNSGGTGSLKTLLTDNSSEDYRAVYVTIDHVDVHSSSSGWETVATPNATYNLLDLVNGVRAELGLSSLAAGQYTEMRLILGTTPETGTLNILGEAHLHPQYLVDQSNTIKKLKVPSGFNSGIKIVHNFEITDQQTSEILLDFDALKSIVQAGASGQYLLKPTIKAFNTYEMAQVSGLVDDGTEGLEGVFVSAQKFTNILSLDPADRVSIVRSTLSAADNPITLKNEAGEYSLDLLADDYNLVAYAGGYLPVCSHLSLTLGTPQTQDFSLAVAKTGTISGEVSISSASADQHATLDFRQSGHCTDSAIMISVKSVEVVANSAYVVTLPVGNYQAVVSSEGETTRVENLSVSENVNTIFNPAF